MNYIKIYYSIIHRAKNRKIMSYCEKHHIIPKSLGGHDNKNNIVDLTAREHFLCHYLLTKIYQKNTFEWYKMINAFLMMKCFSNNQNRYFNSRLYESLRKDFSKLQSKKQKGINNSQYGRIWIHSYFEKKSIKIKEENLNTFLKNGWKKGRVINFNKKVKTCKYCGQNKCLKPDICKKHQMINTLINYFGFDKNKKGSIEFYNEFEFIVKKINDEYHKEKLSTIQISKKYNLSTQRIDSIFKSLNIKKRNKSEALKNFINNKNGTISS